MKTKLRKLWTKTNELQDKSLTTERNDKMGKQYERVDYRDLLAELNRDQENDSGKPADGKTETKNKELFDRKISDKKVKFIVIDNAIHYKTCRLVKGTSYEMLDFRGEYDKSYDQCPSCALSAYLHIGAEDPNNEKSYREFFKSARFPFNCVRDMYLNQKCRTRLMGKTMYVKNRNDNWKIELLPTGKVKLFHNNYIARPDNTRRITDDYHVQAKSVPMERAVANLCSYDFYAEPERHIVESSSEITEHAKDTELKMSSMQRFKARTKRLAQRLVNGNDNISINGLKSVEEYGFPKDGALCVYIWENNDKEQFWMLGSYSAEGHSFAAVYNGHLRKVNADKVIAWKEMTDYDFRLR